MHIVDKTVLITGASSGIGAAIARSMTQAGAAQVLLLARNESGLKKVAREIAALGGQACCYAVDLSGADAAESTAQRILREVGVPDIVINNAGSGQWKFLLDTAPQEIPQLMTLPYFAAAWLTRVFLPGMLQRKSGHIVNISSVASRLVWPGATAYIAACRAMRGFSDALRADLHGSGVGVTHYESGPIDSPYWHNNPGSRERIPKIAQLLIPVLTPEQVGKAVVDGVRNNRTLIVIPAMMKLVYLLHYFSPWLVQSLMTKTGYHRKGD
jgi:short-subunit dehydrogenase